MTVAVVFALVLASTFVAAAGSTRAWSWGAARPGSLNSRWTPDASRQASVASFEASAAWQQSEPRRIEVTCTFANPAYAGDCTEKTTRTEKEKPAAACRPILDCLNNPNCVKNYCQGTDVRQGWTLKKAE
jgi:hypothetical protein